jgi:hypothetical protein
MEPLDVSNMNIQGQKRRHGCVTAWLVFLICTNAIMAVAYLIASPFFMQLFPHPVSFGIFALLSLTGFLNVFFAAMLLKWKKFGFWGFAASGLIVFGINLSLGLGIVNSGAGLIGIGILYAILQIKEGNTSTWSQLE